MKKLCLLLTILFLLSKISAQATLQGKVIDEKNIPLPYVSVALLAAKDSHLIIGALTDDMGNYTIPSVSEGDYRVLATSVGFEKVFTQIFSIKNDSKMATIDITLPIASKVLDEAVIVAQRPLFEQKADKLVMNVANSPVAAGGTAMEILQKIPGIIVINEQVKLTSNQIPQIWIDGKPSQYVDVNAVLRDMPGDQIDRIEYIAQPGAKYDAAGGPILNIILKRNADLGFTGTAAMTVGGSMYDFTSDNIGKKKYYRLTPSVNMNYRSGLWNVFGSYSYGHRKVFNIMGVERFLGNDIYKQINYGEIQPDFQNARLGVDFYATKKTTMGVLLRGWNRVAGTDSRNVTDVYNKTSSQKQNSFITESFNDSKRSNLAGNFNIKHDFDEKKGHTINFDVDYSHFNTTDLTDYEIFKNEANSFRSLSQQNLKQPVNIFVTKLDYSYPFDSTFKVDVGTKLSFAEIDNDLKFYRASELQIGQSNDFLYKENINAGYVNMNKTIGKIELNAGIRAEQTVATGTTMDKKVLDRDYLQWFPSASALFRFNKHMGVQASYSKRVNRPSFQQQNPFAFFLDSLTFTQGNPSLLPEIEHSAKLAIVYDNQPFISIERMFKKDIIIENAPRVEGNKTFTTAANLANFNNWVFQVNFPIKIKKWLDGYGGNQLIYNGYDAEYLGTDLKMSRWHWMGYFGVTANLPQSFKFEVNGFYMTKFLDEFFTIGNFGGINIGASKTFWEKRGRLSFNFNDVLFSQNPKGTVDFQGILFNFRQRNDTRNLRLTFSYQFGNTKVKNARRRSTGSETETSRIKVE